MTKLERVEIILESIKQVRAEAEAAHAKGETAQVNILGKNLMNLEICLVSEAQGLVDELKAA